MIVVITTPGYGKTHKSLTDGEFGFPIPQLMITDYDELFCKRRLPRATYIFADLERLDPWKLRGAAELFRMLTEQGVRCLNDPARAMCRLELLRTLNATGFNPFNVIRADERPKPAGFPVFLRYEDNHLEPLSSLLQDQQDLDDALANLRAAGLPLRGIVVTEFCGQPYSDGLWHKWGTFRVGSNISVDHIGIDDNWLVKTGVWEKLTEVAISDEYDAVKSNRFADALKPVFEMAAIEYGRADHATIDGRTVVYEINTNPSIGRYVPDPNALRRKTQALARRRFAAALDAIDTTGTGTVTVRQGADAIPLLDDNASWWRRSQLLLTQLDASRLKTKRFEGELLRKNSKLQASRATIKRLQEEVAILKAQLAAVFESRSWRVTAPLRVAFDFVQRNTRRKNGGNVADTVPD